MGLNDRVRTRAPGGPRGPRRDSGFSLIELLIVVAIIGILTAIAVPQMQQAIRRANVSVVAEEARALHTAFVQYHLDNQKFPNASDSPALDLATFEPLRSAGYYKGKVTERLLEGRADAYDSPDDEGPNAEYWLEMTVRLEPSVRFLVCNSNNAPLSGGMYLDGVYMFRNGVLTPIHK